MFNRRKQPKQNQTAEAQSEEEAQLNQDLIVHNMPSQARLSGSPADSPASSNTGSDLLTAAGFSSPPAAKLNFKAVGLIIIVGGLIFIAGLVYLSYRFIIKPTASQNKPVATAPAVPVAPEKTVATATPAASPIAVPTTADLSTVTPMILDLATTTTTTTTTTTINGIMNEELTGLDVINLPPLIDSDNDGLNDDEEALLGTNANSIDSDADTYSDVTELAEAYNPAGSGKLSANTNLAKYANESVGYEILYPKNWPIKSLNNDATVIFTASDDSLIQISVQENSDKAGILSWYENSFPNVTITYDKLKSTDNWDGIMGENRLNFYLTDKKHNNIFVISCIPSVDDRVAYPNIFKLMINSLVIK